MLPLHPLLPNVTEEAQNLVVEPGAKYLRRIPYHTTTLQPNFPGSSDFSACFIMMKLLTVFALASFVAPAFAFTVSYNLTYNPIYDQGDTSLTTVACSNGEYGLITAGYTTYDSLPTFPAIGGAPQIIGWNSPYCGTCWQLTYTDPSGTSQSLNMTAIDVGDPEQEGFNLSLESMDILTDNQAAWLGRVQVTATRLSNSACGL